MALCSVAHPSRAVPGHADVQGQSAHQLGLPEPIAEDDFPEASGPTAQADRNEGLGDAFFCLSAPRL